MMYDLIIIEAYYILTLLGVPFVVLSVNAYGIKAQTVFVYLIVLAHIANEVAFFLSLPSHDGGALILIVLMCIMTFMIAPPNGSYKYIEQYKSKFARYYMKAMIISVMAMMIITGLALLAAHY